MKPSASDTHAPRVDHAAPATGSRPADANTMSRRVVFAGAGAVSALAAAAVVLPGAPAASEAASAQPRAADGEGRYQATAHVKRYYQTARV